MIDQRLPNLDGSNSSVICTTDGFGKLHILIGKIQLDKLKELLDDHKIRYGVAYDVGSDYVSVDLATDLKEQDIQFILDSVQ